MIWGKTHKEKQEIEEEKDNNWFAWRPVKLTNGQWVWWKRIKREFHSGWNSWSYNYYLKEWKIK